MNDVEPLTQYRQRDPSTLEESSATLYKQDSIDNGDYNNDQDRSYHNHNHLYKQNSTKSEYSAISNDVVDDEVADTFDAHDNMNNNRITFNSNISYYHDNIHTIVDNNDNNNNDINSSNYYRLTDNNNINKEVFVFGFGAVVFWGFHRNEAKELLDYLQTFVVKGRSV